MIWSHPRSAGPFNGLGDVAAMAAESASALARRAASYPALVASDKLTPAEADNDIFAWEAIAADWQFIASEAGESGKPATGGTLRARIAALDTAIDRFFNAMDRAGEKQRRPAADTLTAAQQQQITSLLAMRYWAEQECNPERLRTKPNLILALHAREIAHINHELRQRRSAEPQRIAA